VQLSPDQIHHYAVENSPSGRSLLITRSPFMDIRLQPSLYVGETEFWLRPYCRGEQPMIFLKALVKALADS